MTSAIPVEQLDFASGDDRCAAWLTLPSSPGPHPAVVLVHGLGATRDMMLPQYEQHFAAAGIAVLSFDYRFTGASGGQPRQRISIPEQCRDVGAAIDFLKRHPRVDAGRIGLWGTSLGGMNVVRVAGSRHDIAAAVVQCPITHGPASARRVGPLTPLCAISRSSARHSAGTARRLGSGGGSSANQDRSTPGARGILSRYCRAARSSPESSHRTMNSAATVQSAMVTATSRTFFSTLRTRPR